MNGLAVANPPPSIAKPAGLNWPLIPPLEDYNAAPGADFWVNFPYRGLPTHVTTSVNKSALRSLLHQRKNKLTRHQYRRAVRCLSDLDQGADAAQRSELPPNHRQECELSCRKWQITNGQNSYLGGHRLCGWPIQSDASARIQG